MKKRKRKQKMLGYKEKVDIGRERVSQGEEKQRQTRWRKTRVIRVRATP